MPGSPASEIARSPAAWERLAKEWLVEVVERTPLADVDGLPLGWIAQKAPPLIAEILGQLSDPGSARELELPPAARERAASLAAQHSSRTGATRLPRDLAALQSVLIEALGQSAPERDRGEFARAVGRLAEVFGAVQSAAIEALVEERTGGARVDEGTGMPGAAHLDEWLRILVGEHRQRFRRFSLAHVKVDGVDRITEAYGAAAAHSMGTAVAEVVGREAGEANQAFRLDHDEIVLVAPDQGCDELAELSQRLAAVVARSQGETGPQVSITVGVACFPEHGDDAEALLAAAEEAAWGALAEGRAVGVARVASLQDP